MPSRATPASPPPDKALARRLPEQLSLGAGESAFLSPAKPIVIWTTLTRPETGKRRTTMLTVR